MGSRCLHHCNCVVNMCQPMLGLSEHLGNCTMSTTVAALVSLAQCPLLHWGLIFCKFWARLLHSQLCSTADPPLQYTWSLLLGTWSMSTNYPYSSQHKVVANVFFFSILQFSLIQNINDNIFTVICNIEIWFPQCSVLGSGQCDHDDRWPCGDTL